MTCRRRDGEAGRCWSVGGAGPDWGLLCGAGPGSGLQLWAPQLVPASLVSSVEAAEAAAGGQHVIWRMVSGMSGVSSVLWWSLHCVVCSVHT